MLTNEKRMKVLERIASHYMFDPRRRAQTVGGLCRYYLEPGKVCAVGFMLQKRYKDEAAKMEGTIKSEFMQKKFRTWVKPSFKDFVGDWLFLEDLQRWHDIDTNWEVDRITKEGMAALGQIKGRIKIGYYDTHRSV